MNYTRANRIDPTLIKENINIMDLQGIIIASGQKNRLGEPHKGAEEVLRSKKTVEISFHGFFFD